MRVEFFSSGELVKGWTGNLAYPKFEPMGHLMSRCAPGVQVLTTAHSFIFFLSTVYCPIKSHIATGLSPTFAVRVHRLHKK